MGKGSMRRPTDQSHYNEGWERVFGKPEKQIVMDFRPNGDGKRKEE
jgi:hypothetical protein